MSTEAVPAAPANGHAVAPSSPLAPPLANANSVRSLQFNTDAKPSLKRPGSDNSQSSVDSDGEKAKLRRSANSSDEDLGGADDDDDETEGRLEFTPAIVTTPLDEVPPLSSTSTYSSAWGPPTSTSQPSRRGGSLTSSNGDMILTPASSLSGGLPSLVNSMGPPGTVPTQSATTPARPSVSTVAHRPHAIRTPSNAYAPYVARRPSQFPGTSRARTSSVTKGSRQKMNPNAEYRAQEKAYMDRIRQDAQRAEAEADGTYLSLNLADLRTPSLDLSSDDGSGGNLGPDDITVGPGSPLSASTGGGIPSAGDLLDEDYEQDTLLYYGNDDMQPTAEEMKIPENRERMEWHTMLASVLTGEVVIQEKKRLRTTGDQPLKDETVKEEIWLGLRARCLGRTLQAQRKSVEKGRAEVNSIIDSVIGFEVRGHSETGGKSAIQQVDEILSKIEKMESMFINHKALREAHPRVGIPPFSASVTSASQAHVMTLTEPTTAYAASYDAIVAWHNTMKLIEAELNVLRKWVGNDELNFSKPQQHSDLGEIGSANSSIGSNGSANRLADESSFIDRILKEDGLKSLQNHEGLLVGLGKVINQAKKTLIHHYEAFTQRHLPPYIEELQTLINFPSRLVKEIIRIRLSYAKKIKDFSTQPVMTTEQMIVQFQILINLAIRIKDGYNKVSRHEPGWDPPDCLEENFDTVVVDALKFYFKLLNWKLTSNKNAFKEAEIMEQEWEFSTKVGRMLDGGDVEVAEQFSSLTSKALIRLNAQFEKELQKRPEELSTEDVDKLYKTMLDSVRIRQRKLFRFSRILTQRFENCAEYNLNIVDHEFIEFQNALVLSGHIMVSSEHIPRGYYIIACPSLIERPQDVQALLGTSFHPDERSDDMQSPYVLILRPESPLHWAGSTMEARLRPPLMDLGIGRLRLVADGSQQRLANAKMSFMQSTGFELTVLNEQRASLPRVNVELKRIKKTAFNLSNAIMSSVEIIRNQTKGMGCQELIQTCYQFATEFGQRSITYMDPNRRALNSMKLLRLALDWIEFICDDCNPTNRMTFRWAVTALDFAMIMTQGQNLLSLTNPEYSRLRAKVAGCMSLLVSHFDIMGARSTLAAQAEKQRLDKVRTGDSNALGFGSDEESAAMIRQRRLESVEQLDDYRLRIDQDRAQLGKVLEDTNDAVRALTYLSSSSSSVHMRWQQGQFIGGGTFGSVYAAINLDTNELMAVKEIRLQDPQMIPTVVAQIRDEMNVLQVLDHPNVVSYYGIEPHRDKVYLFMEYCDGGSLASLLEHGRIEDETVTIVYALQMVEGLAYLHARGVVHRDIKPENILLDHDGVIKFVDFGAAKVIARQTGKTLVNKKVEDLSELPTPTSAITSPLGEEIDPTVPLTEEPKAVAAGPGAIGGGRQTSLQGTPMYMSPEVIRGLSPGRLGAADIWSLGCVILEMVTGRRPWAHLDNEWAIMYNIAQGNTPQLPSRDQISDAGIKFLERCFERDPSKRASAAELLQDGWISYLKNQLSLEPATPMSDVSGSGGSLSGGGSSYSGMSRHNSMA